MPMDTLRSTRVQAGKEPPPPPWQPIAAGATGKTPWTRRVPVTMFVTGVLLMVIALWFLVSMTHYTPETAWFPFRTAGWFIIGFPFVLAFSLGYSAIFGFVSRWTGRQVAWGLMLLSSAIIIWASVHSALPASRLRMILGQEAAAKSTVEYLRIRGSFCDGQTMVGKVSGPTTLLQTVVAHHALKEERKSSRVGELRGHFRDDDIPEYGKVYSDARGFFYWSPATGSLYFIRFSRE